jgi:protein-tyrosine phosphatase
MKILFVCTGNICRSPLAEGILRSKLDKKDLHAIVDSAGFENFHVNDPPDDRAIKTGKKYGIDISGHRGRLMTSRDAEQFDRIYVMDSWHYRNAMKLCSTDDQAAKIDLIMNSVYPGQDIPVKDPWYSGMEAFEEVYHQLDDACEKIAIQIEKQVKLQL